MTSASAVFQEQESSGTANPLTIVNPGFATRNLNTTVYNTNSSQIDISGGSIVLTGPGTFIIKANAVAHNLLGEYSNQLYNSTSSTVVGYGDSTVGPITGYTAQAMIDSNVYSGEIVISDTSSVTIELQSYFSGTASGSTAVYGQPANSGNPEVYANAEVIQIA